MRTSALVVALIASAAMARGSPVVAQTTSERLEAQYFKALDDWVAGGPVFREGHETDDATFKARVQPLVETCGKLVMLTATAKEKLTFVTTGREEFDLRVDICVKMTVNRLHAQPEFQKPQLVRKICDESAVPLYWKLCLRSGLRK